MTIYILYICENILYICTKLIRADKSFCVRFLMYSPKTLGDNKRRCAWVETQCSTKQFDVIYMLRFGFKNTDLIY